MKHLFIAILAVIGFNANAQVPVGFGLPVSEKAPKVERIIELALDRPAQLGLLRIEFQSDIYPVYVIFHGDTIARVNDPSVRMVDQLPVHYVLTEEFRRSYNLHMASKAGSVFLGTMELSMPSIADAQK